MGFSASIDLDSPEAGWKVSVTVKLTRAESNDLFMSGDSMVSWPMEGLLSTGGVDFGPERSGMFVSEIAARSRGLTIRYEDRVQAERAVSLLRAQFVQIGIEEET